jgi:hypothetical protein
VNATVAAAPDVLDPFDPSHITKQKAWLDFIDSDWSILSRLRHRHFVHLIIPVILVALTVLLIYWDVERHINVRGIDNDLQDKLNESWQIGAYYLSLFAGGNESGNQEGPPLVDLRPPAIAILELTARIIFQLFTLPFLALANGSVLFWGWSSLKQNHPQIFRVKIFGMVFLILCGCALICGFAISMEFPPLILPADFAQPRSPLPRARQPAGAPICNASVGNLGIVELAALPMLAQSIDCSNWEGGEGLSLLSAQYGLERLNMARDLYASIFTDQTPRRPEPSDLQSTSLTGACSSYEAACIFFHGKTDCSDVPTFADTFSIWCNQSLSICTIMKLIFSSLNEKALPDFCMFSVDTDRRVFRTICNPFPAAIGEYACSQNGSCKNWDELCHYFPSSPFFPDLCGQAAEQAFCGPGGFCAAFNFSDKCDAFDVNSFVYRYHFQLSGQFIGMRHQTSYLLVSPGFVSRQDVGIAVENVGLVWFHFVMQTIVPFYRIFADVLLKSLMGRLGQQLTLLFFGPNRMPLRFAQEATGLVSLGKHTAKVYESLFHTPMSSIAVGHSHCGLTARAAAINDSIYGVSFEGSQYDLSPIQGFFPVPDPSTKYRLINEASGVSLFAMHDDLSMWNYRIPDWQKWWKPANPYETFCLLVAGCTADDRYDAICNATVGAEQFQEYMSSW